MAEIADVLDNSRDAAKYRKLFDDVKEAFGARYLLGSKLPVNPAPVSAVRQMMDQADAISRGNLKAVDYGPITSQVFDTDLFTPTQTAYVLALHFDLLPQNLRSLAGCAAACGQY